MNYKLREVYAAGPITGLGYNEARLGWRRQLQHLLPDHILVRSPMRGKEALKDIKNFEADCLSYADQAISSPKGIVTRDANDIESSDACVMNLLGSRIVSTGTVWEIGRTWSLRRPMILIMERAGYDITVPTNAVETIAPVFIHSVVNFDNGTSVVRMKKNPHTHAFVTESAGYWVESLEEAASILVHLLTPGI